MLSGGRRPDRLSRLLEDVHEQEDEDAGGGPGQEGPEPHASAPDPGNRQTEEDGEAGEGAEDDDLRVTHGLPGCVNST